MDQERLIFGFLRLKKNLEHPMMHLLHLPCTILLLKMLYQDQMMDLLLYGILKMVNSLPNLVMLMAKAINLPQAVLIQLKEEWYLQVLMAQSKFGILVMVVH